MEAELISERLEAGKSRGRLVGCPGGDDEAVTKRGRGPYKRQNQEELSGWQMCVVKARWSQE